MKIIADENIVKVDDFLADIGTVKKMPGRTIAARHLHDADILLVRSVTNINASLLAGSSVRFIASATAGINHINQHYLDEQGITFTWAPGCNARAVVEYVMAAIMQMFSACNKDWRNTIVGIIGRGQVGKRLHRRLSDAGAQCLVYDPLAPANDGSDCDLDKLLSHSDIITLHTPMTTSGDFPTWHLVGNRELSLMKPDALLINASRGSIVDNRALSVHLAQNPSFMTVLDVWEDEPELDRNLLEQVDLATGHIAGYTLEGKLRGTQMICNALCRFIGKKSKVSMTSFLPDYKVESSFLRAPDLLMQANALVKQVYDITADSQTFKSLVRNSRNPSAVFDHYRKHYPVRREFSNIMLTDECLEELHQNPVLVSLLGNLGFCIASH